jgi:hypothetical protein
LELSAYSDVVRLQLHLSQFLLLFSLHQFSSSSHMPTSIIANFIWAIYDSHKSIFHFVSERSKGSLFDPTLLYFPRLFSTGIWSGVLHFPS